MQQGCEIGEAAARITAEAMVRAAIARAGICTGAGGAIARSRLGSATAAGSAIARTCGRRCRHDSQQSG